VNFKAANGQRFVATSRDERPKSLLAAVGASLGATLAGQTALVVSGVLVARMLGPANRGYLALFVLSTTVLFLLGGLGLPAAVSFYTAKRPAQGRAILKLAVGPLLTQILLLSAMQGVVIIVFVASKPSVVRAAGMISIAAVGSCLAADYALAGLQGLRRSRAFNILRSMPAVLYALGTLLLFMLHRGSLETVTVVWVLASTITAGAATTAWRSRVPKRHPAVGASPSRVELLRFGLTGLLGTASPLETLRLDQAVVGLFLSPTALGLYVVGAAFTNLPRFIGLSIGLVMYPHLAARSNTSGAIGAFWRFFVLGALASLVVSAVLAVAVGYMIPLFFGSRFVGAVPVARYLLFGAAFLAARRILADGARGLGKPGVGSVAEAASWLWLCPALVLLTPTAGLIGVSQAFASASLFSLLVASASIVRHIRIQQTAFPTAPQSFAVGREDRDPLSSIVS